MALRDPRGQTRKILIEVLKTFAKTKTRPLDQKNPLRRRLLQKPPLSAQLIVIIECISALAGEKLARARRERKGGGVSREILCGGGVGAKARARNPGKNTRSHSCRPYGGNNITLNRAAAERERKRGASAKLLYRHHNDITRNQQGSATLPLSLAGARTPARGQIQ